MVEQKHKELYYWFFPGAHAEKSKWEKAKLRTHLDRMENKLADEDTKLVVNTEWSPSWVRKKLERNHVIQEDELSEEEVDENTKVKAMGEYLEHCCAGGTADLINELDIPAENVEFKVDPSFSIQIDKIPGMTREELENKIKELRLDTLNQYLDNLKEEKARGITGEESNELKNIIKENKERIRKKEGIEQRLQEMDERYPELMQLLPDEEFDTLRRMHTISQEAEEIV